MTPFASALLLLASASPTMQMAPATIGVTCGQMALTLPGINYEPAHVRVVAGAMALPAVYRPILGDLVTNGSSTTSGNPGHRFQDRIDARTDGGSILNLGVGGTTGAQIRDRLLSQSAEVQARWQTIQQPGNGATTMAGFAAGHGYLLDCLASMGHLNYLAMPKFNDGGMAWGGFEGTGNEYLRYLHRQFDPLKTLDLPAIFREIPGLTGQDAADQVNNLIPTSMRLDASHANQTGLNFVGDEITRWVDSFNLSGNGLPFFPAFMPIRSIGNAGRYTGGRLAAVPYLFAGSFAAITVSGGIPGVIDVVRDGAEIVLRNASAGPLLGGRYKVPVTLSNSVQSATSYVYLYPSSATTAPSTIALDGNTWVSTYAKFLPDAGAQFTLAIDLALDAADDGRDLYLALTQSSGLTIRRLPSNAWRFSMRTTGSPGASVFTVNTPSGSAAGGVRRRLVFSADALAGTAQVTVDGTAYTANWTPDGTPFNTAPDTATASVLFCGSSSGRDGSDVRNAIMGSFSQCWIGRVFLAGGSAANDAFYTAGGAAKNLGGARTVGGVAPDYLWRGSAGDFASGVNEGLAGQVFPALRSVPVTTALGEAPPELLIGRANVQIAAGKMAVGRIAPMAYDAAQVQLSAGKMAVGRAVAAAFSPAAVGVVAPPVSIGIVPALRGWLALQEMKDYLRLAGSEDDALVQMLIQSARHHIETLTRQVLEAETRTYTFDALTPPLLLPEVPVRALASLLWTDADGAAQLLDVNDCRIVERAGVSAIYPAAGVTWPAAPAGPGAVQVTANVGPAARDDLNITLRHAGMLLVAHWYRNREAVAAGTLVGVPFTVDLLLNPLRRWSLQ